MTADRFNRTTLGYQSPPLEILVEREAIRLFADAIGADDPTHFDVMAAQAAGHPNLLAPPTFVTVLDMQAARQARRMGIKSIQQVIQADDAKLLHGEETHDYFAPIYARETVTVINRVAGFADSRSGHLEMAYLELEIQSEARGLLVRTRSTLIHQLQGLT